MSLLPQLIADVFVTAAICTIVAMGFALIYCPTGFFCFSYAATIAIGPYFVYWCCTILGLPRLIAVPLAILVAAAIASLMELMIYRPIRYKRASPLVLLLCSLGMYVVLQNVISALFGDEAKSVRSLVAPDVFLVLGARVTLARALPVFIVAAILAVLCAGLLRTKMAKAIRATASDRLLAETCGIWTDRVILESCALGSALGAIAGIAIALDVDMTPTIGMSPLMLGVVAVIVGGVRSILGIPLAALLLALSQNVTAWVLGSGWQDGVALVVLFIFLLCRPQGSVEGRASV